jgi:hypothetical protein
MSKIAQCVMTGTASAPCNAFICHATRRRATLSHTRNREGPKMCVLSAAALQTNSNSIIFALVLLYLKR